MVQNSRVLHPDKLREATEILQEADPRWVETIIQMTRTACGKGKDYGNDEDNLANLTACRSMGIAPWVGTTIRMRDKEKRIDSFLTKGELHNESLEDAIEDAAVYAVHRLTLYREDEGGVVDGEIVVPPFPWEKGKFLAWRSANEDHPYLLYRSECESVGESAEADAEYWWPKWHEAGCPGA